MTREEREAELRNMMQTGSGRNAILSRYKSLAGISEGSLVTTGMLYGQMIRTILEHECPPKSAH